MKKFFYLLLALPLVFAACEPDAPVEPGNDGGNETPKEYAVEITSNAEMEFPAEGGTGVIEWEWKEVTRSYSPVPETVPAFTTEAEWITLDTENLGAFTVAANEGEVREAVIVVTYLEQVEQVKVKQAAKAEVPQPSDEVVFEASMLVGYYYHDEFTPDAGNYYIFFTDNGFDEDGYKLPNSVYYTLDVYAPLCEDEPTGDFVALAEGTYTFDANDTMVVGTIGNEYSAYTKTNDTSDGVDESFEEAELVVSADGSYVLNVVVAGVKHTVTFSGEAQIVDTREVAGGEEGTVKEFNAAEAMAYYRGDYYSTGVADNFTIMLSDNGWDADGWELPNSTYCNFDIYTEIVDGELVIPNGTYTIDPYYTLDPYTIDIDYSFYYLLDDSGWDYVEVSYFSEGTVTVSDSGIVAELLGENGVTYKVTYNGVVTNIDDVTDEMGGGGEGGDDYLSTLESDLNCDFTGCELEYTWYGDFYEVGCDNWLLYVSPTTESGDGLQLDLVSDTLESYVLSGEYTITTELGAFTAYCGWDNYGYMEGCWYYKADLTQYAPLMSGNVTITNNGDTTFTIEVNAYDDRGNNITGSWTGVDPNQVPSEQAMSIVVKQKQGLKHQVSNKMAKKSLNR